MLAQVNADKNKVDVYERAEPSLLLRNLANSTAVQFPNENVNFPEASFGKQKVGLLTTHTPVPVAEVPVVARP